MSVLLSRQYDKGEFNRRAIDWHAVGLAQSHRLKTITPSRGVILLFFCPHKQGLQRHTRFFFYVLSSFYFRLRDDTDT